MPSTTRAALEREHIDSVRAFLARSQAQAEDNLRREQVSIVVTGLLSGESLSTTAARTGLGPADGALLVRTVITRLGTWLGHSRGSVHAHLALASARDSAVATAACTSEAITCVSTSKTKPDPPVMVFVPDGYEEILAHAAPSLAAVLVQAPDADTLARFVERTYATRATGVTYPVLAGVWGFATRGRLAGLPQVSPSPVFLTDALTAYDILETSRVAGLQALTVLTDTSVQDLPLLRDALEAARWVDEGTLTRLERLLADDADPQLRERAREHLRRLIAANPGTYAPTCVGELNLGQMQRISEANGVYPTEKRRGEERMIRDRLVAMGLSSDVDMLLRDGLRASDRGHLEKFWEILAARVDGDTSWPEQLDALRHAAPREASSEDGEGDGNEDLLALDLALDSDLDSDDGNAAGQ